IVEVKASKDDAGRLALALRSVRGVAGVEGSWVEGNAGWARLGVAPGAGGDADAGLREPIRREVAQLGLQAPELTRAGTTLEHVFVRVIEGDEAGGDGAIETERAAREERASAA